MRHLWLTVVATLMLSFIIGGSPVLATSQPTENTKAEITLTVEQKSEQGAKANSRFDERYKQLEQHKKSRACH